MVKLIEITGKALSGEWGLEDENRTGIPVLRTTNFTNLGIINYGDVVTRNITKKNISEKFLRKGDIIIEKSGGSDKQPVGRVVLFNGEENRFLFNNFTGVLRVKDREKWVQDYVFYALFANYRNGGTRKYENKTTGLHNLKTDLYINNYEIEWTNIAEQKNVCATLRKIESIISDMNKEIDYLDELIKARFVEMFEDNFGEIVELGNVCDVRDGTHDSPKYHNEGYPLVTSKNICNGKIDFSTCNLIQKEDYDKINKRSKVEIGDILMPMIGTVGNPIIINTNNEFAIKNVALIKFKDNSVILNTFVKALLESDYFGRAVLSKTKGGTQKFISLGDIRKLELNLPPIELQNQFAAFVAQVDKSKFTLQNNIISLMNLWYNINQYVCERTYGEA